MAWIQTAGRFTWAKLRRHFALIWTMGLLLAIPHLGTTAMMIGSGLGLVVLCFTTELKWANVRRDFPLVLIWGSYLVLPLGLAAMLIFSGLGIIVLCFTIEFTSGPFDPTGRRVRIGFIAVSTMIVALITYTLFQLWRPGH
jgi:uncharacterized membrane protein